MWLVTEEQLLHTGRAAAMFPTDPVGKEDVNSSAGHAVQQKQNGDIILNILFTTLTVKKSIDKINLDNS